MSNRKQQIARAYIAVLLVVAIGLLGVTVVSMLGVVPTLVLLAFCASLFWALGNSV